MNARLFASALLALGAIPVLAQDKAQATPPVSVPAIVTVEARRGGNVPALNREDFMVYQGKEKLPVSEAVPLQGNNADLDLFVLLDDGSDWTLGSELADLRRFIDAQPASTAIGIGYMRNGTVDTVAKLTRDHDAAAKALRLPMGTSSSPWLSLSELVRRWPAGSPRREVVMLSSGSDPLGGDGIVNPYLDAAIADAQRAGVIVYAIYTPGAGHAGHSYWRMNWGQNHLAELAEETGGEAYILGFGAPVSIAPYLAEVSERLSHQYKLTLQAKTESTAGLRSIRMTTEVPNAEIVAATKVYVPASPARR